MLLLSEQDQESYSFLIFSNYSLAKFPLSFSMIRFHWDQPSLFGDSNMNVTKICRGSSSSWVQPQTDRQYHFHWCPSISKAITGFINQGKQVNIFRWAVTFVSDWQHVTGAQLNQWKVVFTDYRLCLDIYKFQDVDTITASSFFLQCAF